MTGEHRQQVARYVAALPEVAWDRLAGDDETVNVFGWITRSDGQRDFALLRFAFDELGVDISFSTSSAKHSAEFTRRLFGPEVEHSDCERVSDVLGDLLAAAA